MSRGHLIPIYTVLQWEYNHRKISWDTFFLTSSTYELLLEGYLGEVGLFVMRFHEITLVCLSLSLN